MVPILYTPNELEFRSNGIGRLADCISCTVTEERNGTYECEFEYPITGPYYQEMHDNGGIVCVIHDDNKDVQPFDIYSFSAPIDGIVTFYAHHISYRLNRVILEPFTASSCAEAMVRIPQYSHNNNPFTFWTDKATAGNFKVTVPQNVRQILGGQEGSILDTFGGGDYEFDLYSVKLYADRGSDKGVTIRYGKNLSDITQEYDESGIYNAIAPYWKSSDGSEVVFLPEMYVVSSSATGNKMAPWTTENRDVMTDENGTEIDFNYITDSPVAMDFSASFQEKPTVDQLRQKALSYLASNKPWIPAENVTVNFTMLWQTPEYENVASLQRVALCDYVSVYYPELGVIAERQKVIKTVYNVLLERFDEMELGKPSVSLAQQILGAAKTDAEKLLSDFGSVMQAAIDKATDLITGGLGGYVVFNLNADGQPQEILIMDTPDIATAVNVIRMNRNGIGFSTSGYQGPFRSAWTIDGAFVADFITAGTLNANIIKTGILSDYRGMNSWDLLTGEFLLTNEFDRSEGRVVDYLIRANIGTITYAVANWVEGRIDEYERGGFAIETQHGGAKTAKYAISPSWEGDVVTSIEGSEFHEYMILKNSGGHRYTTERYATPTQYGMANYDADGNWDSFSFYLTMTRLIALGTGYDVRIGPLTNAAGTSVTSDGILLKATGVSGLVADSTLYSDHNGLRASGGTSGSGAWTWGFNLARTALNVATDRWRCIIRQTATASQRGLDLGDETSANTWSFYITKSAGYLNGKQVTVASSSSLRYKHAIQCLKDPELDPHKLLELKPRQFIYNADFERLQYDDMRDALLPGFIAEEVADIYPAAAIHDPETGEIESWDERRLIPGMLALIQEQQKKIDDLEARLAKLERMVETKC